MDLYMMKNTLKVVLLTSMLPFAASAAEELSPWYIGGGLGISNYQPNCEKSIMKICGQDDPYAWDVLGGYLFNENFGLEFGWRDLGHAQWLGTDDKKYSVGADGATLGLVGIYPFADKWSLSGELGVMAYLLENRLERSRSQNDDFAPYIGAGIGYNFTDALKLQLKYRRYENLDADVWSDIEMENNYWGLELTYRFSSNKPAAAVAAVAAVAAPVDSDNDGVNDNVDQCPATPSTHKVDANGCTVYEVHTETHDLGGILFDNNSSVIKSGSYSDIEKLANYMKNNPEFTVSIEGHASNVGKPDYNMALSERRANAVAEALQSKYGVEASRVNAVGFGITKPIVEGNTPEAHKQNRRIEAIVTGTEKRAVLK